MSELGRLKMTTPNDLSQLAGTLTTLRMRLSLVLTGDEKLCDARHPSHTITARAEHGHVEVGKAWLKTVTHGPRKGERFLSLTLDDPDLGGTLNVAAFPDKQAGDWVLVWRRRQPKQTPAATAAAA